MALYVVYAVVTYILSALLCMYIPHCMRTAGETCPVNSPNKQQIIPESMAPSADEKTTDIELNAVEDESRLQTTPHRKYGFMMSIMGAVGTTAGGTIALVLVIILAQTLPAADGQTAGLLVTTVVGFITIAGSVVSFLGLPVVPAKSRGQGWKIWWLELFTPFRDLLQRKNMLILLLAYTIYVDTVFALSSVTSQLYYTEVKPDTLEYSLYSLAGNVFQIVTMLAFYFWQIWRPPFSLEHWLILGYALILIVPIWGCIGLANVDFGLKVGYDSAQGAEYYSADIY